MRKPGLNRKQIATLRRIKKGLTNPGDRFNIAYLISREYAAFDGAEVIITDKGLAALEEAQDETKLEGMDD